MMYGRLPNFHIKFIQSHQILQTAARQLLQPNLPYLCIYAVYMGIYLEGGELWDFPPLRLIFPP